MFNANSFTYDYFNELFIGYPLHSASQKTASSAISVDFDAVFGGKSAVHEFRTAAGKATSCVQFSTVDQKPAEVT